MTDSIIKIEILRAIKEKTKLSEIQLGKLFNEYRINVLIPNSIRLALINAKTELENIKIPEPIRYDERIDTVKTNQITHWGDDPKYTFKRKKIPVLPINFDEITALSRNKLKLSIEIGYLEKIEGIVNYYITDQINNKTKQDFKPQTKLKPKELKGIIIATEKSTKFKSLNIKKGITLNHKQLEAFHKLACNLHPEKQIEKKSFISKIKQMGYSKERISKEQ